MAQWGTISNGSYGVTLTTQQGDTPQTPSGLLLTKAVETKRGWIGQIIVDKEIVWESAAFDEVKPALEEANGRVVERVKRLFVED